MRLTYKAVILFALLLSRPSCALDKTGPPAPVKTVRVLFIGNSLTYTNDLPQLFADFAKTTYPRLSVVVESVAAPGESLKGHWLGGDALRRLKGSRWDYVVLQEKTSLPTGAFLLDGAIQHELPNEFFDYGERFIDAAVSVKAKPILYQTYEGRSRSEDLPYLDYAYMTLGRKTGTPVAPVARIWHRVDGAKHLNLYDEDGLHPSLYGSYLAAAAIASTIFGDPRSDTVQHPASIPESAAREILAAVRAVRKELAPTGGYADVPAPRFVTRPMSVLRTLQQYQLSPLAITTSALGSCPRRQ